MWRTDFVPRLTVAAESVAALGGRIDHEGIRDPRIRPMPSDSSELPTQLFGREAELATIAARLDAIRDGGGALVVRGEPGIGKSALLRRAAHHASERGWDILRTTAVESEVNVPFAALHQLLLPMLGFSEQLPDASRAALQSAFGSNDAPSSLFQVAIAVLQLLGERDERAPLLVLIDDMQWLDASSADALAFIARRLESDPIVVVFAIRDGSESALLRAALPELVLHPLDEKAAGELLDTTSPALSQPIRERILHDAAGNPLALVELPTAVRAAGIESGLPPPWLPLTARLERIFSQRLATLTTATRQVLLVIAADECGDLAEIATAVERLSTYGQISDAIAEASAAGLVEADPSTVHFRHPLMRSAIYNAAKLVERQAVHVALADVVPNADRRAWHLAAGVVGVDDAVADALEVASKRASWQSAHAAALRLMDRAARLSSSASTRATRLLWAAEQARYLGRHEEEIRLLGELQDDALPVGLRVTAAFEREIANQGAWTGVAAAPSLIECVDRLRRDGRPLDAIATLRHFSMRFWWSNPDEATRAMVIDAAEGLTLPEDDSDLVTVIANVAPVERGAVAAERIRCRATTNLPFWPSEKANLGVSATAVGDFVVAERFLQAAVTAMRSHGSLGSLMTTLASSAWTGVHRGNWRLAAQSADECMRLADEQGERLWAAVARLAAAMVAAYQGDMERAELQTARAEKEFVFVSANPMLALVQLARGAACLAGGRPDAAYEQLRRIYDAADIAYHPHLRAWALVDLVDAAIQANRQDDVAELVAQQQQVFARAQWPLLKVHLDVADALLSSDERAEGSFEAALESNPDASPFLRARLQLAYGAWLKRHRHAADSRPRFRTALEMFNALGATSWAERASRELRASGETIRRAPPAAGWLALTPQELQIAELAAEGLTNKEIARQLFLSHRTVGGHLYRIFPKLGVTVRSQLHTALSQGSTTEG
jgi:DNA-binding CsgD family transcriptional regulator